MNDTDWIRSIARIAGFDDDARAAAMAQAVLEALGRVLMPEEQRRVAEALSETYRASVLQPGAGTIRSLEDFYDEVARREGVRSALAIEHAQVVCRAFAEVASEEVLTLLGKHLPAFASELFERPRAIDAVVEADHGTRVDPGSHTLATGRPGSRHPLSDSQPHDAHTHSVAVSLDPHGDTKLSSATGLTQEREDESLASGRPPRSR